MPIPTPLPYATSVVLTTTSKKIFLSVRNVNNSDIFRGETYGLDEASEAQSAANLLAGVFGVSVIEETA